MEAQKTLCTNCGANITNHQNCEFCGSLLIRLVDKGIEIDKKRFSNEAFIYPGLAAALKKNMDLQVASNGKHFVVTDADLNIYGSGVQFICSNQLPRSSDGTMVFPLAKVPSISVSFYFAENPIALRKFKQMDIYALFVDVSWEDKPIYAIDFGEDYIGAAQIFTTVMREAYGATEYNECTSGTWAEDDDHNTVYNDKKYHGNEEDYYEEKPWYEQWWVYAISVGLYILFRYIL